MTSGATSTNWDTIPGSSPIERLLKEVTDLLNDPPLVVARRQVIKIHHLLDVVPHLLDKFDVDVRLTFTRSSRS